MLEILAQLLQDAGFGTMGDSIFVHRMDASVTNGIMLRWPIAGVPTNIELPGYFKTPFQVIVRAALQAEGDTLSKQVAQLLTIYNRDFADLDGNFALEIKQMYPTHLPITYPWSDGRLIEWSINMHTDFVQA